MELYNVVLFVHVMMAIFLVGMGFSGPIMMAAIARTATVASMREWARAQSKLSKAGPPAAVVLLLSGLYMTWSAWSFSQAWIIVALVLFVAMGAIAGAVLDPAAAKLLEAAEAAPDGPVPDDLRALATHPRAHNFEVVLFGLDLAAVFIMTNKPGLTGALLAVAGGLAVAAVRIALAARRHAKPAVAA